jgi:hypothetical protein
LTSYAAGRKVRRIDRIDERNLRALCGPSLNQIRVFAAVKRDCDREELMGILDKRSSPIREGNKNQRAIYDGKHVVIWRQ